MESTLDDGRERATELRGFVRNLQRRSRRRPLVDHRGREVGQARLAGRIGAAAGLQHETRRDDRQTRDAR